MSKHYKDGTPIDDKLLDDLVKSKSAMAGHFNLRYVLNTFKNDSKLVFFLRQILFATIDQIFHENPEVK